MYQKNLSEQIKLRVSKEDLAFLVLSSEMYGISVSQYLRNMIRAARVSAFDGFPLDADFGLLAIEYNSEDVHDGDTTTDKLDLV